MKDGKIKADSKDAVTGNQLHKVSSGLAEALGATVAEDGTVTAPSYTVKDKTGADKTVHNVGDALSTINERLNEASAAAAGEIGKLKDLEGISDKGKDVIKKAALEAFDVQGDDNVINVESEVVGDKTVFTVSMADKGTIGGPKAGDDTTKNNVGISYDGPKGTISTGKDDKAIEVNGGAGTITAGNGKDGNKVTIDGTKGSVTAGNEVDEKGIPKEAGSTTSMDKNGFSVATKDKDGKVSKVDIKNGGITAGVPLDKDGKPADNGTSSVSMGKDGFSVTSKDKDGNVSTITIKDGTISGLKPGTEDTDVATVGQVKSAIGKTAELVEKTSQRLDQVGAHSAALAAMNPLSYDPLRKSQIMAGIGSYAGNQALALGIAHYANENFMFNAGFTMGSGKSMANIGATYRFGTGDDDNLPERYKGGPISSVYVMQDEITALKAENARKDAENAEMKAQIKMLMERMGMA